MHFDLVRTLSRLSDVNPTHSFSGRKQLSFALRFSPPFTSSEKVGDDSWLGPNNLIPSNILDRLGRLLANPHQSCPGHLVSPLPMHCPPIYRKFLMSLPILFHLLTYFHFLRLSLSFLAEANCTPSILLDTLPYPRTSNSCTIPCYTPFKINPRSSRS
jgi:hypothetical protein